MTSEQPEYAAKSNTSNEKKKVVLCTVYTVENFFTVVFLSFLIFPHFLTGRDGPHHLMIKVQPPSVAAIITRKWCHLLLRSFVRAAAA